MDACVDVTQFAKFYFNKSKNILNDELIQPYK